MWAVFEFFREKNTTKVQLTKNKKIKLLYQIFQNLRETIYVNLSYYDVLMIIQYP